MNADEKALLEALSDKVRRGEPISFIEAIAVVNYQGQLAAERKAARDQTLLGRLRKWLKRPANPIPSQGTQS